MRQSVKVRWVVALALLSPFVAQAQSEFEHAFLWTQAGGMQDLGTLPGFQNSVAYAISDVGEVVGYNLSAAGAATAFRWTTTAGMRRVPGASTIYSVAVAVNNSGDVAGVYYPTGTTTVRGFIWTQAGGFQDIGTLGGSTTAVTGMNRSEEIVGYSETASGTSDGFMWTPTVGIQDIGTFVPIAINDDGVMAGYQITSRDRRTAAVWNNGPVASLCPGVALAISNLGQVTGEEVTHTGQAFLRSPGGGGLQLLPMLPGAIASFGQGINSSGEIVGWSQAADDFDQAFIWTPSAGTQDIGNLGGKYGAQAFAINDSGQVVGSSTIQ